MMVTFSCGWRFLSLVFGVMILLMISKSLANSTWWQLDTNDWKSLAQISRRMKNMALKGNYVHFMEDFCKKGARKDCNYPLDNSYLNFYMNEWRGSIGRNISRKTNPESYYPMVDQNERRNMHDVFVRVTTIHNPPLTMLKKQGDVTFLTGYVGDVWRDLQGVLNFRYLIYSPKDGAFGNLRKSDCQGGGKDVFQNLSNNMCEEWNGMIGQLIRNEVDLIATPMTMTDKRLSVLHFSSPILRTGEGIFIRMDTLSPPSHIFYSKPFSGPLWLIFCILVLFLLPLMLTLLCHFTPNCDDSIEVSAVKKFRTLTSEKQVSDKDMASIFHWIIESLGIFCQQGLQYVPHSLSIRVTLVVSLFTSTVVYNVYSGCLASFLAIEKETKPPFRNLEDMLHTDLGSHFTIGILSNSSLTEIFSSQKTGVYKDAWARMNSPRSGLVSTRTEGFNRACSEMFAFFTMKASYEGYKEELSCRLHIIPESTFNSFMGLTMRKGYIYSSVIDETLMKMMEVGVLHRQRLRWWPQHFKEDFYSAGQKEPSEYDASDPVMKISLQHVHFVFGILFIGCVLSLIILVLEIVLNCQKKKK